MSSTDGSGAIGNASSEHIPLSTPPINDDREVSNSNNFSCVRTDRINMLRKRRRQRPILCLITLLAVLVAIGIVHEQGKQLNKTEFSKNGFLSYKGGERVKFDVNAPPNPKAEIVAAKGSVSSDYDDYDRNSFIFWGQQANRLDESKTGKKRKNKSSKQKQRYFPVVEDDEETIPQGVAGSVIRAADALLCRESVIDYVVNATDLKDECDGLKKAYTINCGDYEDKQSQKPSLEAARRLTEQPYGVQSQQTYRPLKTRDNPLIAWQNYLYYIGDQVKNFDEAISALFMAMEVVRKKCRLSFYASFDDSEDAVQGSDVRILEQNAKEEIIAVTGNGKNKTSPKTMLSLELPTTNQHVSEKMLSETLMLQNGDKIIASAVEASKNQTNATINEAVADAAASSKAVADTTEFISTVLNDPTSVEARTCCASILNVFHENCSVGEEEEISDSRLFIIVFVIALCGLIKSLIRHFQLRWLPEAAGCILVGVFSGWLLSFVPHHDISFEGNWFLRIMVPPIVFEAALSIDKRSFNRHIVPILIYAVGGTILATGLTAVVVHHGSLLLHGAAIPYIEALTFGALISSIDPIAVLSVLSNMGMTDTDTIYVVIFGESLLNDGVAIVLFQTLVHFLDTNLQVDSQAIMAAAIHFCVVALGSLLVGVTSGFCCTLYFWGMHGCQTPLVEVLMFCCWALLPYYVCDGIEWSGIVAVVATGFVMDVNVVGPHGHNEDSNDGSEHLVSPSSSPPSRPSSPKSRRRRRPVFSKTGHLSSEAKTHIGFVTEIVATMMETAIFAYLGLFLFSFRYHWNVYHTALAIGGCCLSRAIMIPSLSFIANWITRIQQVRSSAQHQQSQPEATRHGQNAPAGVVIDRNMQLVLWFAGLRGAMSFALVEHIPLFDAVTGEGTRFKSELKAMTSACIIFTVFILGGTTYYMMDSLGMAPLQVATSKQTPTDVEMIALLTKSRSNSESCIGVADDGHENEIYLREESSSSAKNIFRQRIQQT